MKKRVVPILIIILVFMVSFSSLVFASWQFKFPTIVKDTSATLRTYYPVLLGYTGQSLIDAQKVNSDGLNSNMQIGSNNAKYMLSTTQVGVVIPNLPANGQQQADLYTGYVIENTTLTNGSGTVGAPFTSPVTLSKGANTINIATDGTFTVVLPSGIVGVALSGTCILTGSPLFLASGNNTITTTAGAPGNISVKVGSFSIITGDGGYITILDNPALEPSTSFTFEMGGYIDTSAGASKDIVYKNGVIQLYISSSARLALATPGALSLDYLLPSGVGDLTNIGIQFPVIGAHWDKVDDPVGFPDDMATYVQSTAIQTDTYTIGATIIPVGSIINSVKVFSRVNGNTGVTENSQSLLRLGGVDSLGAPHNLLAAWTDYTDTVSRPGGGAWSVGDLATLQVGITLGGGGAGGFPYCTQLYVIVDYTPTATLISGTYILKMYYNGVNLKVDVDSGTGFVNKINVAKTASFLDNATDWIIARNEVMPYMDYFRYTTAIAPPGEKLLYQPNTMLTATTLVNEDNPGTYNGIITYGANTNVTLSYGAMESFASTASSSSATGGFAMPSSSLPSTWFASGQNLSQLPFYDSFLEVSAQTGQPLQTIYFIGIIGLAFGVFFVLALMTRSALLGILGFNIVLFIGSSQTIVPMWIPFSILLVQVGIIYLYRQVAY